MILPLPRGHRVVVTRMWVAETVEAIWGFRLQPFQLEDLEKMVRGGIYALMYPTDHGKSMLIEMCAVLRLIVNPNRRFLVIKINEDAADETAREICRKMRDASYLTDEDGRLFVNYDSDFRLYPWVEPVGVRWDGDAPWGVTTGFDVQGIVRAGRNTNRSVRCYGLGSKDLQGKRGDTMMDDIERQEEAKSQAYRSQLETRVSAVYRTLEDDPEALWVAAGTPTHEESIYYTITQKLGELGVAFEEIWRPIRNEDGTLLWADRAKKVEIHRRLMSKTEWNSAYELRPNSARKLTRAEVEELLFNREMPWIANEKELYSYLLNWSISNCPPGRDVLRWQLEVTQRLESLSIYTVWDPATTGDWAVGTVAIWGRRVYPLRCHVGTGDTWEQVLQVKTFYQDFPSSTIVVEKNAQQKAFKDVAEEDDLLRYAPIESHGTYSNKNSDQIGIPAVMNEMRDGWWRIPYQDEDRCADHFSDFVQEVLRYGPTAHPHMIVAYWFGWAYHRKHEVTDRARSKLEERAAEQQVASVKINWPENRSRIVAPRSPELRKRASEAWGRRHR